MMSDNYNLDAIPNTIFDNIVIDNSLNLDEIFDITFMQDPEPQLSSADAENGKNPSISSFEVDMGSIVFAPEASKLSGLQHDCMWSGVCQDPSHPAKSKNMKFSVKNVCREFEKELGWTSSSESESESFTEGGITIESILKNNMPKFFESKQSLPNSTPPLPSQLVSNVISQPIPRYPSQTISLKHPVNIIRNQYILPPNTTIQAPPGLSAQFHVLKSPPPLSLIQNAVKVDQAQPSNVVKFIPKAPPCSSYQCKDPVIQQHKFPAQLKIEPIYIYNTEHLTPPKPLFFNYGKPLTVPKDPLTTNEPKRGAQKRKSDPNEEKQLKKQTKKKSFETYNCTMDIQKLPRKYGSDTDDPSMSYEKRNMHNNMERQRRIGMRNLFVELKKAIPTLDDRDRVPKVNILKEAISYCTKVQRDENLLAELRRQHNRLVNRAMKLGLSPKSVGSSTSSASSYTGGED